MNWNDLKHLNFHTNRSYKLKIHTFVYFIITDINACVTYKFDATIKTHQVEQYQDTLYSYAYRYYHLLVCIT